MSCKSALSNSVKSNCESQQWMKQSSSAETNVKLAGEEAKDRLYEPKHKKKLVRVLTVVAYIFSVSLAAIMLSLYYMFLWNPNSKPKLVPVSDVEATTKPTCVCPDAVNHIKTEPSGLISPPETNTEPAVSWHTTTEDSSEALYDEASSETKLDNNIPMPKLTSNYDPDNILSNETYKKK